MSKYLTSFLMCAFVFRLSAQPFQTDFERSAGVRTTNYQTCINHYRALAAFLPGIHISEKGMTDAGHPLHLVLYCADKNFDSRTWNRQQKIVILINNGIHPGEPDGIDASMMLLRDAALGKIKIPSNIVLAVIPIYNIGGALNRNNHSRVNQDGPESYGFRGDAQNLDLNRDFTKCDSKNAKSFAGIFHELDPNILIDNHVSDGADYQYVMTLLSTQYDKLGGALGSFLRNTLDPDLYRKMSDASYPMIPYVNVEDTPGNGWHAFYDPPRFSSGYAALFQCIAYVPETHMLKPFKQRVEATYALMKSVIDLSSKHAAEIIDARNKDRQDLSRQTDFALGWKVDSSAYTRYNFRGFAARYKPSAITGKSRLYYDHATPYEKQIPIYDHYTIDRSVSAPKYYVIPQGWHSVVALLKLNHVHLHTLRKDTIISVNAYHINNYQTLNRAYEKHYKHYNIHVSKRQEQIQFLKGDFIISVDQPVKRFIVEMLEPEGEDSYFSWNFFDAILQQKEGYSDYRWEDVAETYVAQHPEILEMMHKQMNADTSLANNASQQLDFVYHHSPYYEAAHLRYPVYRIE